MPARNGSRSWRCWKGCKSNCMHSVGTIPARVRPAADVEAEHFYDLRQIKLKRLQELDKQAAMLGDAHTPVHVQVERAELRAELGLVEGVIGLPQRPSIGEELGPN